ncbi:pre-mRNA splicing factor [Thelephora ganbajun]|uniref:Pre-mRNA splicing factor n=1 Tax=Thelephora ganbajun TaxID=370292 RepID=A0ACB6ZLJ0_THEGA|nr:pre-mRNA splicing factor [Thelephora ganbajun]
MDALKAEIATKRKAIQGDTQGPSKYTRRGDLERLKAEREQEAREEAVKRIASQVSACVGSSRASTDSPLPDSAPESATTNPESSYNLSNEETIRRLRVKGQPIRLFGESDRERRLRLRALELIEERDQERQGGQNDFKKALEDVENVEKLMNKNVDDSSSIGKRKDENKDSLDVLDLDLLKTDPQKVYPIIYYALKRRLKEWEEWMDQRPEHIKRSTQGKLASATQRQSAEYLKPFFKMLRQRSMPDDMLPRVAEIVHHMQKRQYQRANDAYLRLSIGNAPWPIGVTMVGIHERSAREKISTDQVAHVLNDEVSRKYIQSLKRLLTFSQTKYPPDDVTQLMG